MSYSEEFKWCYQISGEGSNDSLRHSLWIPCLLLTYSVPSRLDWLTSEPQPLSTSPTLGIKHDPLPIVLSHSHYQVIARSLDNANQRVRPLGESTSVQSVNKLIKYEQMALLPERPINEQFQRYSQSTRAMNHKGFGDVARWLPCTCKTLGLIPKYHKKTKLNPQSRTIKLNIQAPVLP